MTPLRRLLSLVIGAGLVTLVVAAQWASAAEAPAGWRLACVGAMFFVGDLTLLHIRFRRDHLSFTFAETALVIGLVLVPTPWVVVLSTLGVGLVHLVSRRGLVKVAFNATSVALGSALAAATVSALGGAAYPLGSLREVVALLVAAFVFTLWNGAAVSAAVGLSQRVPVFTVFRAGHLLRSVVCGGNAVLAIGVALLAAWSPTTLVVVPPLLGLAYGSYRGYLGAMRERDTWQQLEGASKELGQLAVADVVGAAVVRAAQLFEADRVTLALSPSAGQPGRSVSGTAAGELETEAGFDVLRAGDEVLTSVSVQLAGPNGTLLGTMHLSYPPNVSLSRRQRHVLATFCHTVSVALQNARLYEQMTGEAVRKAHEACHDALTGLPNRSLLEERTDAAIAASVDGGTSCALLLVDLDHFKEINDTLGHAAGDAVLREVARRFEAARRPGDTVARLGGDEFAVLLTGLSARTDADPVAETLLDLLAEPLDCEGLRLSVEGSLGIACAPTDATSFAELLQRADVAMYQAKGSRGSFQHYRSDLDESSVQRLALIAELRGALDAGQITVHFQPQVEIATGRIVGVEALARWQHPERGLLPPVAFVDAAEHSGLIRPFTMAVLEAAVRECAGWRSSGQRVTVSVNLGARNLMDRQLPDDVARVLDKHGLPADRLLLEITETTMMSELDVVEDVLGELRGLGVQISVDDFGTGYSSLSFLQRVAVNELKIDRCFVKELLTNDNDAAIVRATVQLAHSLGLRAVAEGVEDRETFEALGLLGCELAQGYCISKPIPSVEMAAMLAARPRIPAQAGPVDTAVESRVLRLG